MFQKKQLELKDHILPDAFVAQMTNILGSEVADFLETLQTSPPVSIRYNPLKSIPRPEELQDVLWCDQGGYLPQRKLFILDPFFHAGGYYVQEASSMIIGQVVRQLLPVDQPLRALDLCAAPGGKSTLIASLLPGGSLLLCNEVIRSRYQILRENLTKWGSPVTHGSQQDSSHLQGLNNFFDFVLVDAPCSGEGLFRKDPAASKEWSPEAVKHCAARQKRILADAVPLLRPGGILCYSTCTYNELENTANAQWLAETFGLEEVKLKLDAKWGIVEQSSGYQCYPHRVRGEGLYLVCFRKTAVEVSRKQSLKWKADKNFAPISKKVQSMVSRWFSPTAAFEYYQDDNGRVFALPSGQVSALLFIRHQLRKHNLGIWMGTLKRNDFVPSPDLALSTLQHEEIPRVDLTLKESLHYLKKENIILNNSMEGWALACYEGQPMGWIKGLKNRINNYYPKEWRIRMRID